MRFINKLAALSVLLAAGSVANLAGEPWWVNQTVGVSGNHMTLNGAPWLSRGVTLQGLVGPLASLKMNFPEIYNAQLYYGERELNAIRAFGADTIRFQVSQPSLDPQSPLYDAEYVSDVIAGLKLARQNGFVVMIMMQDEAISGETTSHPLAIEETLRDWDMLNSVFGKDRGVMFELYNEPHLPESPANWLLWANGDPTESGPNASIGMQTMITHLRAEGSLNAFVLDGLGSASTLQGVPILSDSLNRLVYAVHPYQHGSDDESQWDAQFGTPSLSLPVYADEWSAQAGSLLGLGQLSSYQVAVDLLNYLRTHKISLGAGAFDIPDFMVQDVPGWTPTNYDNYSPVEKQDDAGLLVRTLFQTYYLRPLTAADGLLCH